MFKLLWFRPCTLHHYPNYSWSAFLSLTGVRLQQIHNKDMYEMIEKGLRGGMTQCAHKKVEANNKYMNEQYDMSKPSSYISYLDAHKLVWFGNE